MSVLLVTHCYAKELPQYAAFLRYQLSSLVLYKPAVKTRIVVCYSPKDELTASVLRWFLVSTKPEDICLSVMGLTEDHLFRRSVGRNRAALASDEDLIWFTDVDHVFGEGCIDSLWNTWNGNGCDLLRIRDSQGKQPTMVYPKEIQILQDHATGDRLVEQVLNEPERLWAVDPDEFVSKTYNRAIGGIQIVPGRLCREIGYLHGHQKWCSPRTDGKPFGDFHDDVVFRGVVSQRGEIVPIELPNLFRLRHTRTTYQ